MIFLCCFHRSCTLQLGPRVLGTHRPVGRRRVVCEVSKQGSTSIQSGLYQHLCVISGFNAAVVDAEHSSLDVFPTPSRVLGLRSLR